MRKNTPVNIANILPPVAVITTGVTKASRSFYFYNKLRK